MSTESGHYSVSERGLSENPTSVGGESEDELLTSTGRGQQSPVSQHSAVSGQQSAVSNQWSVSSQWSVSYRQSAAGSQQSKQNSQSFMMPATCGRGLVECHSSLFGG